MSSILAGVPDTGFHLTVSADLSAIAAASAWVRALGGRPRLVDCLNQAKSPDVNNIALAAAGAADGFAQGQAQGDDVTLLAVCYDPYP